VKAEEVVEEASLEVMKERGSLWSSLDSEEVSRFGSENLRKERAGKFKLTYRTARVKGISS